MKDMYKMKVTKISILFLSLCVFPLQAHLLHDQYGITYNKNIYAQSEIRDLIYIPQNDKALSSNDNNDSKETFDEYYDLYFKPWNESKAFDLEYLQTLLSKRPDRLAENYQIIPEEFYSAIEINANVKELGSLQQTALVINNSNLRVLPTNSYLFKNPNEPGEGYPFDYAQDDYLGIGEPLLISHYTKDGRFAYIRTSTGATGFVLSQDIVKVDKEFISKFKQNLVMLNQNTLAALQKGSKSSSTLQLYIGTILPLVDANTALMPIRNANGTAELVKVYIKDNVYISKPLSFSKANVSKVVNELIAQPYGWGGNLFHMDCARLVRNYFAVFGVHMPLLSKEQSNQGKLFDLKNLNNADKKAAIIKHAIPYQSLLCMPGHIGIYMGMYNNEPIMLHSSWGIRLYDVNDQQYKYIIGKSIITTLIPGKELIGFDAVKSSMLSNMLNIANTYE
jgi:cell wall-associated NlpC family hydrolase